MRFTVVDETSPERQIKAIVKAKRAEIQLKYRLLADEEIAQELPALKKRLLAAVEAGETVSLVTGSR